MTRAGTLIGPVQPCRKGKLFLDRLTLFLYGAGTLAWIGSIRVVFVWQIIDMP